MVDIDKTFDQTTTTRTVDQQVIRFTAQDIGDAMIQAALNDGDGLLGADGSSITLEIGNLDIGGEFVEDDIRFEWKEGILLDFPGNWDEDGHGLGGTTGDTLAAKLVITYEKEEIR